jgi:hypothetical protein
VTTVLDKLKAGTLNYALPCPPCPDGVAAVCECPHHAHRLIREGFAKDAEIAALRQRNGDLEAALGERNAMISALHVDLAREKARALMGKANEGGEAEVTAPREEERCVICGYNEPSHDIVHAIRGADNAKGHNFLSARYTCVEHSPTLCPAYVAPATDGGRK